MSSKGSRRSLTPLLCAIFLTAAILLSFSANTIAVPPSPELVEELKANGQLQNVMDRLDAARAKGVFQPGPSILKSKDNANQALSFDPANPDTFRVLVILVDFSDNPASGGLVYGQVSDFEHLLFSYDDLDGHYSMAEFYKDNSYGNFIMEGTVVGWVRAPQTYAYYVDGQNGFGSYPQNAQKMAEDAIVLADPMVDYSQFDADGNGWVDGVFIVHAGAGAEQTGSDFMIWSHKWNLSTTLTLDGVNVRSYTTEPEENTSNGLTTMGVYAHEYGHFIGLPDLYDTDYSSSGIGDWSLMAGGSWNYGGRLPAYMDPWCKKEVGFMSLTNVANNMTDVSLPSSYHEPVAYRLWSNGSIGSQYFLIENRQRGEFDLGVPGEGVVIYHIDEAVGGNSNENHPLVAVEQADGEWDLENGSNQGDAGDVWQMGSDFDDLSTPNSRTYLNQQTRTAVWGISAEDSLMTVNFDVDYSRPRFELQSGSFSDADFGNGNGVPEAGETITFTFDISNLWLTADNVTGTLTADNNDIVFNDPSSNVGTVVGEGGTASNSLDPITFTVPNDFVPCIDSFYLTVDSDNPYGVRTFGFELHIGEPKVLLVDDDAGASWNQAYESVLFKRRVPFDLHDKSVSGSPSAATLNAYETVIWMTGDDRADILSSTDIASMKSFLDNGGNLLLSGQSLVRELDGDDQAFLNDYLHADYITDIFYPFHYGVASSEIGDGIKFRFATGTNQTDLQGMQPLNGGVSEFTMTTDASMISYDGAYKVVLASLGFEGIADEFVAQGWATKDTVMARIMEFFTPDTAALNPSVTTVAVPGEVTNNITDHTPTFSWSWDDTTGGSVIEYQVQVGTGNLCYNWDNMWSPDVFAGSDTEVVYAGAPLEDGQTYVFRVRVNNGTNWSAWQTQTFTMNSVGSTGLMVGPMNDSIVTTATPQLKIAPAIDPDGDPLTYDFEVYDDPGLTSLVTSTSGVPTASPHTLWTVDTPLAEDGHFYWRTRAYDGFEYTPYSDGASFFVNAENAAPVAFSLIAPAQDSAVIDTFPRFHWSGSADTDAGDSVRYTLWTSTDADFTFYDETVGLTDTFRTITYPLTMGQTYYWKVKAYDLLDAETWSSQTFSFYAQPPTCCLVRGDADRSASVTVSDLTFMVDFLFRGGQDAECEEEADADASGAVNVSDLTYLVDFLFRGGSEPPACP